VGSPHASLRVDGHPRSRYRGAHRRPRTRPVPDRREDRRWQRREGRHLGPSPALEIAKKTEGIYAVVDLQAEPATVKELDRQLNLNEAVLRTKVIRPDMR
jgi:hypothetical protein